MKQRRKVRYPRTGGQPLHDIRVHVHAPRCPYVNKVHQDAPYLGISPGNPERYTGNRRSRWDRTTDGFVVIELKRDQGDDETFGQLSRYMGWIAENKDQPEGVPVRGIIIAAQITPKLEAAASTNPNVRLVEYPTKIVLLPKEGAQR